jgi:hypothetical protein
VYRGGPPLPIPDLSYLPFCEFERTREAGRQRHGKGFYMDLMHVETTRDKALNIEDASGDFRAPLLHLPPAAQGTRLHKPYVPLAHRKLNTLGIGHGLR